MFKNTLQEVSNLKREVRLLRSFVIGVTGKDEEGEYRPEFVKRVLKALKKDPELKFKDAKSFLAQLKSFK